MTIVVYRADLSDPAHARHVEQLIAAFCASEFGRRSAMSKEEVALLIPGLRAFPGAEVMLARCGDDVLGVAVCFHEFSVFSGARMLKIHDLFVLPARRGLGAGRALVDCCIERARELGCAFANIEVAVDNPAALKLYRDAGFDDWIAPTQFLELKL